MWKKWLNERIVNAESKLYTKAVPLPSEITPEIEDVLKKFCIRGSGVSQRDTDAAYGRTRKKGRP